MNESLEKVKLILKNNNLQFYNKISLNTKLKQNDFVVINYENNILDRKLYDAKLPFYTKFENGFENLLNPVNIVGNKVPIPDIGFTLDFIANHSTVKENKDISNFEYAVETKGEDIVKNQTPYYFLSTVNKKTCNICEGDGLITCEEDDCLGKHEWQCDGCMGDGKISCNRCGGEGWNRCSDCGGKGKIKENIKTASGTKKEVLVNCGDCSGKGKVKCSKCKTTGNVICSTCDGKKKIECSECYADKKRYGLINCISCEAQGKFIEFDFVESKIENNDIKRILSFGDTLLLNLKELEKYYGSLQRKEIVYNQINEKIDKTEDINSYLEKIRPEFNFNISSYPMLLNELISYKIITCIEFTYNHIISNKEHKGVIINFNDKPEVIYYDNPEILKTDLKTISRSTINIFSRLLKTKSSKIKNDQLIEIKLMIYLAKQDGKIEEEEKLVILNAIKEMKELTNSEKNMYFKLMDSSSLPEITDKDLAFSSKEVAIEIIKRLENLAISDGEYEEAEKDFIQKIKNYSQQKYGIINI